MTEADRQYVGIPWKKHGHSREGCDCVGLTWLWLTEQASVQMPPPSPKMEARADELLKDHKLFKAEELKRGDAVFFKHKASGKIRHVAIYLGDGKLLTIVAGATSRIENGFTLLKRFGFMPVNAIPPGDSERLSKAFSDTRVGWVAVIGIVISLALSAVSYLMSSSTTAATTAASTTKSSGKYSANTGGLATAKDPELPLPDILGKVVVAGNCVYQQLPVKDYATGNSPPQMWNQVIILNSAPSQFIDLSSLQVNGLAYSDSSFHSGSNLDGIALNPPQSDPSPIINGNLNGDTYVPSVSSYLGSYDIQVRVDVRAGADRNFPVYGFSGCSYLVFRLINSDNFQTFNITIRVLGRLCRTFDEDGFIVTTRTGGTLSGADGVQTRFKMGHEDVIAISSLTVNGTSYSEISPAAQTGNVYHLNKTKGFVEFINAPPNAATILVTYTYYPRAFTRNPAAHIIYLLTEPRRGKGFSADRIDWAEAVAARDYHDEALSWNDVTGVSTAPRFQTDYSIDTEGTVQDHLQVLLDACHSALLLVSGKFILRPIKDGASVYSFDPSNIMLDDTGQSSFKASLQDRSTRSNRVKVAYHSEDTLNSETDVMADDEVNQADRDGRAGDNGIVEEDLKFYAVTTYPQASRLALTILRERVGSNWLYTWKTNIQGLALIPGDFVDVTHPSLPSPAKILRLETTEYDSDDRLTLTASEVVPSAYF